MKSGFKFESASKAETAKGSLYTVGVNACESCLKQYTRIKSNNNKQLATTGEALTQPKQQDKEIENYKTTTATAKN